MPNVVINGTVYHYAIKMPAKDPDNAIIFVHGAGGSHKHWTKQVDELGENFLTLAIDLPGHGKSGGKAKNRLSDYTDFVYQFARHVIGSKFYLAGHSMGGAIAMDYAINYPEDLKGLVLIGSGAKLRVNPLMLQTFASGEKFLQMIDFAYGSDVSAHIIEQAKIEMEETEAEIYFNDFKACDGFDVMDKIGLIDMPCLILGASGDKLTPVKYSRFLADQIKNSKLEVIENAGHMMMVEQPRAVNEYIYQFISERSGD